ncbi:serine/threonine protein kinase [Plasmodium yoelii 17X]|uniref:Serine/threonine protein kinase n=1 Tax=Plasmodium yoelii 17X TaxID=1323249 RepID=V7PVD8_PLAYE|nr:serine/threonine protein kinase [Plasmodium yoelii 17X]
MCAYMNKPNLCNSVMLLKGSDKLFYDNLINLDERLKLNNNFNENRYNENCNKSFVRNNRRFKTEPSKIFNKNTKSSGYSFFQNIFGFSKSVSHKENLENDKTELNGTDTGESDQSGRSEKSEKNESGNGNGESGGGGKLYINGLASQIENNLSNKKYELTGYTGLDDKNDMNEEKCVKKKEKEINSLDKRMVNSYVISDVFLKKNIKSIIVYNTGGIDIELIENENPEFLYHTYTGNRISNIYYNYDDKIKEKDSYNERCNDDIKGNRSNSNKIFCMEKEELNCPNDCNQNCDINSSISSLSINISEQKKYKKYYYIGESFNNMRNGWGMLIYNDRVIFEGEYKMDNAIGYFIKYNEYSTEIGYRSPISIKSVIIMSDSDNFIIQNKSEHLNGDGNDDDNDDDNDNGNDNDDGDKIKKNNKNNNLSNVLICDNEHSICNKTFSNFEETYNLEKLKDKNNNSYSYHKIDKNCDASFKKNHNSIKKFSTQFCKSGLESNDYIGINKFADPTSACHITRGGNSPKLTDLTNSTNLANSTNLNVVSNYIRKNSKHKTTPAQSLNYLKPPNMNFIKNNIFLNKNIKKSEKILRKKKKKTTSHTFTPINIIVTSFDSDDNIGDPDCMDADIIMKKSEVEKDREDKTNCSDYEHDESNNYGNYFDTINERVKKNTLDVEIYDEYKNLICANINNDNFVFKNNEIAIFDKFIENQNVNNDKGWENHIMRKTICEENFKVDKILNEGDFTISTDAVDADNDYADILEPTIDNDKHCTKLEASLKGGGEGRCGESGDGRCGESGGGDGERKFCKFLKREMRKKLRGATFPETHDDRQKNCFLFIDDYLTSNNYKFDKISNDIRLRASDYNKWSVNMLYNFLKMIGLKKEAYLFKINKIRGYHILKITDNELKKLNINNQYTRKFILSVFRFLVNSIDSADPLSLNFNTSKKFTFNKIKNISNNDIIILNKIGGGSYAQVFRGKYKGKIIACKLFVYNTRELSEESYCESYISTPRSTHQYIFPKIFKNMPSADSEVGDPSHDVDSIRSDDLEKIGKNFEQIGKNFEQIGKNFERGDGDFPKVLTNLCTLQRNKKIKKMANLEIFRYFPTPIKYRNYEAKILYSLQNCKHVIKLLGVCSLGQGEESLILQYCPGGSLEKYIYYDEKKKINKQNKHLSRPQVVKIFQQIAKGMYEIHSNNFFHRDIKLSNILLDENKNAIISDFGLSTYFSLNDSPSAYAIYGNIFYAAPEVLKGEGFFKESDVWSFGVSLWEALTKKIAYDGLSSSETFCKISSGELHLPIPNDIPKDLSDLLKSVLEYDFTKRPLFDVIARKLEQIWEAAEKRLHFDMISFLDG